MAQGLPDEPPSIYAADGTCTHHVAQCMLTGGPVPGPGTRLEFDGFKFTVDEERLERAQRYADAVKRQPGAHFVEYKLSLTSVYGGVESWGTADFIAVDAATQTLYIADLKDGSKLVGAEGNSQLLSYALAAYHDFGCWLTPIKHIVMEIHQPKLDHVATWKLSVKEALDLGVQMGAAAIKASELLVASKDEVLGGLNPGDHCQYCRVAGSCPARANMIASLFEKVVVGDPSIGDDPLRMDERELADWLKRENSVLSFFKSVRAEALSRAQVGTAIPGFKLAVGRQGNRQWRDEERAEQVLNAALAGNAYERSLISPTQALKKLKGEKFAEHVKVINDEGLITRSEGQVTLVPEADARPAVAAGADEFSDVLLG
jgi:hypothetical protein